MGFLRHAVIVLTMVFWAMAAIAQVTSPDCTQAVVSIPFLTKFGDGWDTSFVEHSKLIREGRFIVSDGQDSGLTLIEYQPKRQVITLPHIEVNPCDHTGSIREWHLLPKQVIGFKKNGHLFAYQILGQMVAGVSADSQVIASNTYVIFYDMHGDGIFDSVRLGAGTGMPIIPDWVKKLSEKKGAGTDPQ
jgi:hypothetical protein